ncbi:MAG: hypothetical protein PQJ61_15670 [Spirochaetales bacterium]|uniref:Uncharacterized protein n=1 Tax=Candidatus Thalassospirochaeta sargassi TaxID=3119039 RepID=A0AAJ1MNT0_9SPIO|nr:hypothetical protein [Spirochaetales bacterium]
MIFNAKRNIFIIIFAISFLFPVFSQSTISSEEGRPAEAVFEDIPAGHGNIMLGMDIEDVKRELLKDTDFSYRGEPDVSMLPNDDNQVIDCDGAFYVERGYFQFDDDKLYLITMVLDEEYVDHYSIYAALKKKYGEPTFLDPSKTIWQNEKTSLSLERPLSIKYIDREVFRRLQQESAAAESVESMLRQDFIDSF